MPHHKAGLHDKCADKLLAHVFGPSGLTSCHDTIAYDDVLLTLTVSVLPDIPPALKAYFESRIEPMLHTNMVAGCAGWSNNECKSINHVLKQRMQWCRNMLPDQCNSLQCSHWPILGRRQNSVRERRLPVAAIISASLGDGRRVVLNVRAAVAAHQRIEMQVSHCQHKRLQEQSRSHPPTASCANCIAQTQARVEPEQMTKRRPHHNTKQAHTPKLSVVRSLSK